MKRILTILLLAGLFFYASADVAMSEPDWFKYFTKSFTSLNKEYLDKLDANQAMRDKYNFKPKFINLNEGNKISFSVEGMDFIYLSVERGDGALNGGTISKPYLIDEKGDKTPVIFRSENLLAGSVAEIPNGERIDFRLRSSIIKVPFNGEFKTFEAEYLPQDAYLRVDVATDFVTKREVLEKWATETDKILRSSPEAQTKDGINREVNAGVVRWLTKKNENGILNDFYLNSGGEKYRNTKSNSSNLYKLREPFVENQNIAEAISRIESLKTEAVKMAIKDCQENFDGQYSKADDYLKTVESYSSEKDELLAKLKAGNLDALAKTKQYFAQIDEALLANPLLDFDEIMLIKRDVNDSRTRTPKQFGFPSLNSHVNTNIEPIKGDWHNTISKLTDIRGERKVETVYDAKEKILITDLELDFNREKILFSMENDNKVWQVYETDIKGDGLMCITPDSLPDVNHFNSCYLPDGNIIFTSDATYQGLPCENGSRPMALIYVIDRKTGKIRQLTYEQDSDFDPVVLNDGRLMYLRWEYSDLPHYFSRILMTCNPDGTAQMEYYGSNSYFPNSYMYARPLPDSRSKVVGIVGGHHGVTRAGRLMIIDPIKGRSEADGVVQEIPYRGRKVEPLIKDELVSGVFPLFLQPYPLSNDYFIVSAKLDEESLWGIYLVDVFDNMTLIKEIEGSGLFDPIPVVKQPTPPVIPSIIKEGDKEATVFLSDIYFGDGLKNIPKGTVKKLRLFTYHFNHMSVGGHASVGIESSWDIKRVLGTVPVEKDGSAMFVIPANTPIAMQPLDSAGRSLQLMRSWFVGMPGENVSCIGCHDRNKQAPPNAYTMALRKKPAKIEPFQGNVRPYTFRYEVQPILDKHCVSCHNGKSVLDFRKQEYEASKVSLGEYFLNDKSYMSLHPYVRRPGPESDIHLLKPMEYHAGTSELVQLLQRGHHGVELDSEDWEALYAWIDLNAPHRGKWSPSEYRGFAQDERRKSLRKRYANVDIDPEAEYDSLVTYLEHIEVEAKVINREKPVEYKKPKVDGWPFSESEAVGMQRNAGSNQQFDLGEGEVITFSTIPSGQFVKGNTKGYADERKPEVVEIQSPFLMSECEITNAQFALFDPTHNSRYIDQQWKDHTTPGYPANKPDQPVIRVSYSEALAFCVWLSEKTGKSVTLPTENQWEWACRAGTADDFWFGDSKTDFSAYENLADYEVRKFAVTGVNPSFIGDEDWKLKYYGFIPRENSVDDGNMIVAPVGSYKPNVWDLYDMHGNVAEWTSSSYQLTGTSQDQFYTEDMKVVKGGSWRDRPKISKAGSKKYYLPYQKVYNVGFRVVIN